MNLEIPTIHLNGTSADRLLEDIYYADAKISEAVEALAQTAPNGRDYYTKGNGALERAQSQHSARVQKLLDVKKELEQIAEVIDAQVIERERK